MAGAARLAVMADTDNMTEGDVPAAEGDPVLEKEKALYTLKGMFEVDECVASTCVGQAREDRSAGGRMAWHLVPRHVNIGLPGNIFLILLHIFSLVSSSSSWPELHTSTSLTLTSSPTS